MKSPIRPLLLMLVLSSLGCAPQSPRSAVNLSGYSAAFRQGYADGCESVRAAQRRDEQRYQKEADYMMGWNDGYSICRRR